MDPRMKGYLRNFNQPAFGVSDTQELVTAFSVEWRHAAPKCTVVYYFPTHFPYQHAPEHACFLPEADDDYDYLEQATVEDSQPIRNRYRNCLHQADAWLEMLLQGVDLDQTILLITGDHGEELFERGRMGHASYLDEPQIRVPCVLSIPGCGHHVVDAVTSHVDLLPTVADALGWKSGQSGLGRRCSGRLAPARRSWPTIRIPARSNAGP
jgi:arylsulfatase A-like enzyme